LLGEGRILGSTTRISRMEWEHREVRRSTTKRKRKTGSKIGSKLWKRNFI
jgi:PAB1-binding protein PBP1